MNATPKETLDTRTEDERKLDDFRKRINELLRVTGAINEKSLQGFTDISKMERLKKKQQSLLTLMGYFESYPKLCQQEAEKFEKAPFSVCKTAYDVEKECLKTYRTLLEMTWENEIKNSKDISHVMSKINDCNSFFNSFSHTKLEKIKTFTMTRDDYIERCTKHLTSILLFAFEAIDNKDAFAKLGRSELEEIQKTFDYFNQYNAINSILKDVFTRITQNESLKFPLLQKIYHDHDFIKGCVEFQIALDKDGGKDLHQRACALRKAVSLFDSAQRPLLSDRTLAFLGTNETEIRRLATLLQVYTPPFHKQTEMPLKPKAP